MNRIDDVLLVAYADQTLDARQRKMVEAYLETDESARRFVLDLIRSGEPAESWNPYLGRADETC